MKLDRNVNTDGQGKYALLNLRRLDDLSPADNRSTYLLLAVLERRGVLQYGNVGQEDEFFLLKLRDRHSRPALMAYADSIRGSDPEFAAEVYEMAGRSGPLNPFCKDPD